MSDARELTAVFDREIVAFESDDGRTRTIVASATQPEHEQEIKIKGEAREGELRRGMTYRFFGRMATHWKHGRQFLFDCFVVEQPAGEDATIVYLQQCDGIGPAKARKVWDAYGPESVRILRESPREVAAKIKLPAQLCDAAAEFLRRSESIERAKLDCLGLLHGRGLPRKTVDYAIEAWGSAAAEIIRRNPYLLMRFRGCGFLRTDKIYLELGHPPGRLKRQALCAWHSLATDRGGDTWHHVNSARDALARNVSGAELDLQRALELSLRAGLLEEYRDAAGQRWIAEKAKSEAEGRIAAYLAVAESESRDLAGEPAIDVDGLAGRVTDHQVSELLKALGGVVGVLAGTPGTGKTHTSAALISMLVSQIGEDQIAVCAPTGKAAVRLTEALRRHGLTIEARTIHSTLGVSVGDDGSGWTFRHGERCPLPFAVVVIDESSMIDAQLMASLLAARGRGSVFLFVGDPNQLSPVGHGAPLRDMISAGMPCGLLTELHRNAGRIVRACKQIREGRRFDTSPAIDLGAGENLFVLPTDGPESQIDSLAQMLLQIRDRDPRQYDPVWDVQIIVAVNAKSPLGRKPLNRRLQSLLNPHGASCDGNPFRVGDKVINTKNGWYPAADATENGVDSRHFVANGEQAEVMAVEPGRVMARLMTPDRLIVIPRGQSRASEGESDDESTGTGCDWELGYAISAHKSQGSEWPIVVVMLDEYPGARMVCSRQWIYTAISRAKTLCVLIGRETTAADMVRRDALFRRKTFLVERLAEMRGAISPAVDLPAAPAIFDLAEILAGV